MSNYLICLLKLKSTRFKILNHAGFKPPCIQETVTLTQPEGNPLALLRGSSETIRGGFSIK